MSTLSQSFEFGLCWHLYPVVWTYFKKKICAITSQWIIARGWRTCVSLQTKPLPLFLFQNKKIPGSMIRSLSVWDTFYYFLNYMVNKKYWILLLFWLFVCIVFSFYFIEWNIIERQNTIIWNSWVIIYSTFVFGSSKFTVIFMTLTWQFSQVSQFSSPVSLHCIWQFIHMFPVSTIFFINLMAKIDWEKNLRCHVKNSEIDSLLSVDHSGTLGVII